MSLIKGEVADGWTTNRRQRASAQYRVQGGFSGDAAVRSGNRRDALGSSPKPIPARAHGFLIPGRAILEFLESVPDLRDLAEKVRARALVQKLAGIAEKAHATHGA